MVFVVGTEDETGGDGAAEVSTGVESETARWGAQHCLPAANWSRSRSRQLLEKAFDEGMLCSK